MTNLKTKISAVNYRDGVGGQHRIYVFVPGENGHLYVNYWDSTKWH
jgi:hypothetical protein